MVDINAKQVQALRTKTGLAMMDCKKALVDSGGDEEGALKLLRQKFADKMSERADKEAANGRIGVAADSSGAALAEVRCETDFVATNSAFKDLADQIAGQCLAAKVTDVDALKGSRMKDGRSVSEMLVDAFGRMKENMSIRRTMRLEGAGACYVHHNGRVGTMIVCDKAPGEAGRHICMHIASTPVILGRVREDVPAELVGEARLRASAEAAGKPQQIIDKIVDGKMNKWYGERVLVEQPFVMDDKKTVGDFAKENGFQVKAFAKYEVGGLE